ncbi:MULTISPECIES: glycerol-3-phosphate dehydrogenase [unclassified Roseateles]|uniref:glycerol-3-phosphate dehydrogenase n=1 Tax=unclassified Roseateles TaxID=2626991 RepID=UPI0006FA1419|nr:MULTISPECIES: glycerol-3-phosphate dehydrogenase [unclassified Roseateles]KQW45580.1 glycerol-3-phosphate dehydrogenase [Pelomonas sp. Root405]KRA72424.1 glycerol-3-phosphate dehydrogenase [Pelomonas sp. Root662]
MDHFDVVVVGGGINGTGLARDLAGRGWRVLLAERDDLAQHTSSSSTKLIHGGLRYLETYDFGLVAKALQEREVLLRSAPHIIRPLRFVLPHAPHLRPAWMIRIGLFLYDHLARRELLPGSQGIKLAGSVYGAPLQPQFTKGFVYSDGWVDDARCVVLNAMDARGRGAEVLTRCAVTEARPGPDGWQLALANGRRVRSRALANAAGPWAESFLRGQQLPARGLRLVKGSHIVVKQRFAHDHAYIFQNPDGRIIFAIPYEGRFTLIGTTDVDLPEDAAPPDRAEIGADEVDYLCEQASRYLTEPVRPADVVWSYAGVRPLLDEGGAASSVTRDYLLEAGSSGGAPLLNIWGGKLTTYRKLAEDGATQLGGMLGDARKPWTREAKLPGGDLGALGVDIGGFIAALQARHAGRPPPLVERLARAYGSLAEALLAAPQGSEVAPGLFEAELRHLVEQEWATCAEDVLWRRSKLGLHYTPGERQAVADWFSTRA